MDIRENPSTCWWWERTAGENRAREQVVTGPTIPVKTSDAGKVVTLVKSDTTGREADQVFFGPNFANFVAVTGNNPGVTDNRIAVVAHGGGRAVRGGRHPRCARGVGFEGNT